MSAAITLIFLFLLGVCSGGTLRISEVSKQASEGAEAMTMDSGGKKVVVFVKKAVVVGDADVRQVVPNYGFDNVLYIEFTDDGAKKLKKTTEGMTPFKDQLAMIIDGRLIFAPFIVAQLGEQIVMDQETLKDFTPSQIDDLARKISGRPPRPAGVTPTDATFGMKLTEDVERPLPKLLWNFPHEEQSAPGFEMIGFIERIKIADPKANANVRDFGELVRSAVDLANEIRVNPKAKKDISSTCDVVQAMAHHFPDVGPVVKKADGGQISIASLHQAMLPYILGDKNWAVTNR